MTSAKKLYPSFQDQYRRLCKLGEGSFGKVYLGERLSLGTENASENEDNSNKHNASKQPISGKENPRNFLAMKKLKQHMRKKYNSPQITHIEQYPEVTIMQQLSHPNILELKQIVQFDRGYELNHYLVMDFGIELMEFAKHKEVSLSREQVKCLVKQLVEAVVYLHSQGIMHRDIKPDNIYLMKDGTLKLGDFSISTHFALAHSEEKTEEGNPERTGNVTTRHYRAPQIIYGSKHYDESIDAWSLGCTIAELILGQTLFPGTTDIHQLQLIFSIIGCPQDLWPEAAELPYYLEFDNSKKAAGIRQILPDSDPNLLDFLQKLLQLNPTKRMKTLSMLSHPYLDGSTSNARQELSKICSYLHDKRLREVIKANKK